MYDNPSLRDSIDRLASDLIADADLIPIQRRVVATLPLIEAILARGVPLRRLAAALANAGLRDRSGKPLSEGHFRAAVSRARSRKRQNITTTTVPLLSPPKKDQPDAPSPAATDFFTEEAATRPDFSGGLFNLGRHPRTKI